MAQDIRYAGQSADFLSLRNITGLTGGNLSVQLTKLEEAGLVTIKKEILDKKMRTTAALSTHGAKEMSLYWKAMDTLRKGMKPRSLRRLSSRRLTARAQEG